MSGIYDGRGGVISKEKNFHIPLPRERRHELVAPRTMNRRGILDKLLPVGRSHVVNFTSQIKEKQQPAEAVLQQAVVYLTKRMISISECGL